MNTTDRQQIVQQIWVEVLQEMQRAKELHPDWPNDFVYGAAIVAEEAGEALKEALDVMFTEKQNALLCPLEKELIQTAATSVRMLFHLRTV